MRLSTECPLIQKPITQKPADRNLAYEGAEFYSHFLSRMPSFYMLGYLLKGGAFHPGKSNPHAKWALSKKCAGWKNTGYLLAKPKLKKGTPL